jgi:hypothetical protein
MPRSRLDKDTVRLVADISDKPKCLVQPTRMIKNPRMSDHPQETTQHKVSHTVRLVAADHRLQPLTVGCMIYRILSMGIHQDIDIRQDH